MTLLVLGVALWIGAHLFKRLAPGPRARLGDAGRGLVAVLLLVSVVLMVWGFRAADFVPVYAVPSWGGHLNNLLMLVAFVIFGAGMAKGVLWTKLRHPMLTGFALWAFAHLLANGDLASLILFGGLGLWALASILLINAQQPGWVPPARGAPRRDLFLVLIALAMYALVAGVHIWLGHNPFGTVG
jgi:uncharacterized membrane protein